MTTPYQRIAFIGGGNMALNLISGICAHGYPPQLITVSGPHPEKLASFAQQFNIKTQTDNTVAASDADIIVLAVKPNLIATVCQELAAIVAKRHPLIISVASGITLDSTGC